MNKKVILFNGPPGSGKDTAARQVMRRCIEKGMPVGSVIHFKMADPLKKAVHSMFGLPHGPAYYDESRKEKEAPHPLLFGMSPREAYIGLSEQAIKPWLGADIFGKITANKIHNSTAQLHVFSDGGFADEWVPIISYLGTSAIAVVELYTPDYSFDADSRNYIGDELKALYPDIKVTRITNNITKDPFDKELFYMLVSNAVDKLMGW